MSEVSSIVLSTTERPSRRMGPSRYREGPDAVTIGIIELKPPMPYQSELFRAAVLGSINLENARNIIDFQPHDQSDDATYFAAMVGGSNYPNPQETLGELAARLGKARQHLRDTAKLVAMSQEFPFQSKKSEY